MAGYPRDPRVRLHNGKFTDGDQGLSIPASLDPASFNNQVMDELRNVIISGGLEPDENQLDQLTKAIYAMIKQSFRVIQEQGILQYKDDVNYLVHARTVDSNGIEKICAIPNGPASTVVDPADDNTGTWIDSDTGIGKNQSWIDMSESRALNVTYMNSTARPIVVSIYLTYPSANGNVGIYVDGVHVHFLSTSTADTLSAIVPPGSSYSLVPALQTVTPVIHFWSELKG